MHDLVLGGTAPAPLAHYLKALAVLRLVAEQADPNARGWWRGETFVLRSSLDEAALLDFFLHRYAPTPIVGPWNVDGAFLPHVKSENIDAVRATTSPRFEAYRDTIDQVRRLVDRLGIVTKEDLKRAKPELLQACRATFSDNAVKWLDASVVLTSERPVFPALMGSGGLDGRLEFSNVFMRRFLDLVDGSSGTALPGALEWLRGCLLGSAIRDLRPGIPIGQFNPGGAGGANASGGPSAEKAASLVNPWDFIFAMEGGLLFAASSARRLANAGASVLSSPFSVRPVSAGYATAAESDAKNTSELWVPLWNEPTSLREINALMTEGRVQVGGRRAANGVDFARAVASLGVDRGLSGFQRYGFQERNGLSNLAVPLQRFAVTRQPQAQLLSDLDDAAWLDRLRSRAADDKCPTSVQRAMRRLDEALMALCGRAPSPALLQDVLVSLGGLERSLARSLTWTHPSAKDKPRTPPCPPLRADWISESDDGSVEFRLALTLAGLHGEPPLRAHLEPVQYNKFGRAQWEDTPSRDVVWHEGDAIDAMNGILSRRLVLSAGDSQKGAVGHARVPARVGDVVDFIEGRVDADRMLDLVWGLMLVDPRAEWPRPAPHAGRSAFVPALYALTRLALAGRPVDGVEIPLTPEIHRRLVGGDIDQAARIASRRLRASGLPTIIGDLHLADRSLAARVGAALLFPLDGQGLERLTRVVHARAADEADVGAQ